MKVREMTMDAAVSALKTADKELQDAKTVKDKRAAAIKFAVAERNARAAQARAVRNSMTDLLK